MAEDPSNEPKWQVEIDDAHWKKIRRETRKLLKEEHPELPDEEIEAMMLFLIRPQAPDDPEP
ncbi:MAG TPA: hypothetical protein VM328_04140 [Fimbriimonadaceae bacterium]|nr:hypothetical protein [Fimbriimonadaceae bacterium]